MEKTVGIVNLTTVGTTVRSITPRTGLRPETESADRVFR
jgi:hypothetical protein